MGMFDEFVPLSRPPCATCNQPLPERWQSKAGPCTLELYYEGAYVDWAAAPTFTINTSCESAVCSGKPYRRIEALCYTHRGTWMFTYYGPPSEAPEPLEEDNTALQDKIERALALTQEPGVREVLESCLRWLKGE